MECKWDIEQIQKQIDSRYNDYMNATTSLEKDTAAIDINNMKKMVSFINGDDYSAIACPNYTKESTNKRMYNEIELKLKSSLKISELKKEISFSSLPKITLFKRSYISQDETLSLVKDNLPYIWGLLNHIIKENTIEMSDKYLSVKNCNDLCAIGFCSYSLKDNTAYIYLHQHNTYIDSVALVHELGHALQFITLKSLMELANIQGSYLSETISQLQELLLIHELKGQIEEDARLCLQQKIIKDFYFFLKVKHKNELDDLYSYSLILAIYLYYQYCTNKEKFYELLKTYMDLSLYSRDIEILSNLGLNCENALEAINFYLDQYRNDASKIKKLNIKHLIQNNKLI